MSGGGGCKGEPSGSSRGLAAAVSCCALEVDCIAPGCFSKCVCEAERLCYLEEELS